MKKITSVIIALVLALSVVTASAAVPEFMLESYNNYTADYSFTLSFESSEELVALLEEIEVADEISRFIDIKECFKSLLSTGATMNVQADISEDFRKAEMALTAEALQTVTVNQNLKSSIDAKMGMWLKMDLDAKAPVFELIYSYPMLNKYMVINIFEMAESEEEKAQMLAALETVFNKEYLDSFKDISADMLEKYAKITMKGATCTVKIDNEGLVGMIGELLPVITEKIEEMTALSPDAAADVGIIGGADGPTAIYVASPEDEIEEVTSALSGIQILGKDGITYEYSLFSGKISRAEITADISLDISKLVSTLTGEEWQYQSKGVLDFLAKSEIKFSKIGSTKVDFPELTGENSFSLKDMMPEYDGGYEDYYYEESYPYSYVWAYADALPVIDGEYYVPLRATLEDAYYDEVSIEYNKGTITVQSDWFDGFNTLAVTVNSEDAYTDGVLKKISRVIVKDGTTYVGASLFEDLFGWEIEEITHYIMSGYFEITFCTV